MVLPDRASAEKQQRIMEVLKNTTLLFKRLHTCWEKSQEHHTGIEPIDTELLISFKEDGLPSQKFRIDLEQKKG